MIYNFGKIRKITNNDMVLERYMQDFYNSIGGQFFSFEIYNRYCEMLGIQNRISQNINHLMDDMMEYSLASAKFQAFAGYLSNKTGDSKFIYFAHDIIKFIEIISEQKEMLIWQEESIMKDALFNSFETQYFKNPFEVFKYLQQPKFAWMLGVTIYKGFIIPGLPVYFMNNIIQLFEDLDKRHFFDGRGGYEEEIAINIICSLTAPIKYKNYIDNLDFSIEGQKGEIDFLIETPEAVYVFEIKTQLKNTINWSIDNHKFENFKKGISQLKKNESFLSTKTNKKIYKVLITSTTITEKNFLKQLDENEVLSLEINTLLNWAMAIFALNMNFKDTSEAILFLFETFNIKGNKMAFISKVFKETWKGMKINRHKRQWLVSRGVTSSSIHDAIRKMEKEEGFEKVGQIIKHIFKSGEAKFKNNLFNANIIPKK